MDEGGESSSSHQVYPDEVYSPETQAKPDQPDSNMASKYHLENPFVDAILEETSGLGSTSRFYDTSGGIYNRFCNEETWQNMSCMNLLSIADATIGNGVGGVGGVGGGGGALLSEINYPPQTVTEPWLNSGLAVQFTPVTPDKAKSADYNKQVELNENGSTNLNLNHDEQSCADVSTLVEGNQDLDKGISEQTNLNETPQPKERRRKHRPKVVTEGKPKRQRKAATPKKPETPNPNGTSTGKRNYVRKKGIEKPTETPNPSGTSTGKRKYVRRKVTEKPTETPIVEEQTKKSCKRKIDFNEPEQKTEVVVEKTRVETDAVVGKTQVETEVVVKKTQVETEVLVEKTQVEHVVDLTCSSSDEVENCQKDIQSGSPSPITPSKSEIPQGRSKKDYRKAKCKINFLQETHDKGPSSVPSPNQSNCSSTSECSNKVEEPTGFESLESFLTMFHDYSSGRKQGIQLPALYKKKPEMPKETAVKNKRQSNRNKTSGYLKNTKKKKPEPLMLTNGPASHQQNSQLVIADKNQKNKKPMMPSFYHGHQFTNYIGYYPSIIYNMDALIYHFERLNINGQMREQDRVAMVPYMSRYYENNALVEYQQGRSMVPYDGLFNPMKRRKSRAKVDLDKETERVWRLLLEDINSQGIDGTDEEKAKWWEDERKVFRGRADSFIARMHLVQGDRRFSKWKGSVLDSVVGVFLTQNVSDHLSSSAFMSLAAKYPLKSNSSSKPIHEEEPILSFKEPCHTDEEDGPMMLQEADSFDKKEVVSSNDVSKNGVGLADLNNNSKCEVQELPEKDQREIDEIVSSENSADTSPSSVQSSVANNTNRSNPCSMHIPEEKQNEVGKDSVLGGYTSFVELLHKQGATTAHERTIIQKNSEKCASEESGISVESTSQTIGKTISSQESANSNCEVREIINLTNVSTETSKADESSKIVEASGETVQKVIDFNVIDKVRIQKTGKQPQVDWDNLRLQAELEQKREKTQDTMDSLDYEAVRNANVSEIADAIKERGMNNKLAARIKAMLDRLVEDHGSTDLEWLRDVPPDKAKEYLLSFRGLGLKSVECIRLLTLHHLAFPVDTNVGRIAVRLGWVPLQSLPESLQLHLLELYPIQESIQKYLWPRLCKLDQKTLYELHYQMITFGKVFCTKTKPNCNACPLRGECRHFASAFASARLGLPAPEENKSTSTENKTSQGQLTLPPASEKLQPLSDVEKCISIIEKTTPHGPIVEMPASPEPTVEMPTSPEPIVEVPATPEPEQIQHQEFDIEDFCEDSEEIPLIKLNMEEFTQNLQTFMERNMELGEGGVSKALVSITSEAASIPTPKLKNVSQLRTEHQVYELPDSHPLLEGLDTRQPDDPCSYLLAIWTPGETADSMQPPEGQCSSQESGILCNEETCFFCSSTREANAQTVRGTLLIPCRTAMKGSFPLNGTYFQVNEVFADHESSLNPIDVPRSWLWNLPRRMVYFGTSIPTIFKGLTTEDIQYCFWKGFVCVRGFDQKTRAPRPLMARLHFPASKLKKPNTKTEAKEKITQ